jgi:hypothetical protein
LQRRYFFVANRATAQNSNKTSAELNHWKEKLMAWRDARPFWLLISDVHYRQTSLRVEIADAGMDQTIASDGVII